ncbi:MAG TPA: vitamin K epoxide reductase family protein [Solirubrobacterales bacterium]|nr:vitamin K epoxide reductase family protein [Solirubrobacterales bacterium]
MRIPAEPILQRLIAFVAALGLGVATYIAIADAGGGAPACLAGGSGCQTVADSSYSHLAGINVAVLGIVAYALLLASAFLVNDAARFGGFLVGLVGFGFSVYLTYIELFKIEAVCQWCVASALLMTILFLLSATRLIGFAGADGGSLAVDET